jgi:hypothetical protein
MIDSSNKDEAQRTVAGPTTCNSLPETVRVVTDTATFQRFLKTHFFNVASYNRCLSHDNASPHIIMTRYGRGKRRIIFHYYHYYEGQYNF